MVSAQHKAAWFPNGAEDCAAVMAELDAVLADPQFAHSKRYPALLRYLVEHTLSGDVAHIKERTLGIEVFGRPATYDTTSDTVVRFTASEVRRRLATYYLQHDDHSIHIALPIGSYVPEFFRSDEAVHDSEESAIPAILPALSPQDVALRPLLPQTAPVPGLRESSEPPHLTVEPQQRLPGRVRLRMGFIVALVVLLAVSGGLWTRHHAQLPGTAIHRFWYPLAHEGKTPLLIAGGNVFSNNGYSGTETATREVDYPFVSMQIASAMTRVSSILQTEGSTADVQAANAITLTELRDRPVVLIGGYNNIWTARLIAHLPIVLAAAPAEAFQEEAGQRRRWERDRTQPYSAADDYALIARFPSATTGNMVVLVAGIGRNGTEGAAHFLTEERHLQALENKLGHRLQDGSFEAVLAVPVIQGKTGSPTVLAVESW